MKILVIAPQPFFTPRGTPFSVYYRTLVACALGHQVDLLTYGEGDDVDISGCTIHRIPHFWFGPVRIGPSLQKLILDVFMVAWTVWMLLRRRYDVVHAHEEAVFWCRWLKPIFRFRLIYDMHSSLPQQLHNFRFTNLRIVHWVFKKLEYISLKGSDAVITICPALRDYARSMTSRDDKVLLIENSLFDPVRFSVSGEPVHEAEERNSATMQIAAVEGWISRRDRQRIISYAGTFEVYQGIDRLLEAFSVVVREMPGAGLLIVGGLPAENEKYRAIADSLALGDSIYFTGQVPPSEAQRLTALGNVSVSPRYAGNNTPMKIYAIMGSGIPLVATRIESHTQVLNDDIAMLANISTGALAAAIVKVLSDPDEARAMAARAKAWYLEHYSREAYTAKMRKLFALVS